MKFVCHVYMNWPQALALALPPLSLPALPLSPLSAQARTEEIPIGAEFVQLCAGLQPGRSAGNSEGVLIREISSPLAKVL